MSEQTTGFATGDTAPEDRYVAYGVAEDVDDGEGGTVTIERTYETPRIVAELGPRERGNLLVASDTRVSAAVAAQLAE